MSSPKYAPVASVLPLMHGSTSPSKKRLPSQAVSSGAPPAQVTCSRTRAMARRAGSLSGSSPNRRRSSSTWKVSVQSCDHGRPPHCPSGAWSASRRAPQPSVAIRARSAATRSAGASDQVAHHLPADRRIRVEQPVDGGHRVYLRRRRSSTGSRPRPAPRGGPTDPRSRRSSGRRARRGCAAVSFRTTA